METTVLLRATVSQSADRWRGVGQQSACSCDDAALSGLLDAKFADFGIRQLEAWVSEDLSLW